MLLLDEPLSALDRSTRDRLRRELKRIHSEIGITIFHITHDLSEAFFLADRLVVIKEGAILQEGRPEEILERPANKVVAELLGIENFIPARVREDGRIVLDGLGSVDPQVFSVRQGRVVPKRVYVTLPGWSVELFPEKGSALYLWQGKMRIVNMNHGNIQVEVELEHESGERLRTYLSRREAAKLSVSLGIGVEVRVGLLGNGVHWVLGDDKPGDR